MFTNINYKDPNPVQKYQYTFRILAVYISMDQRHTYFFCSLQNKQKRQRSAS